MKTLQLTCKGKVQGVFYRASAKTEAERLGLTGWVRNKSNGDVEIVVTGNESILDVFVSWCKQGPPLARVSEISIEDLQLQKFDAFEVTS
ncbi:MAG: acylphosphatase [Cyclobacteriaceae bacterium]|nr:acylphosphatase [Cyclobacteriaceae bacterium HetDA_MAG_MS6]